MKIKKEYIALAVVIVALSLYLILRETDKTHYQLPELEKIDRDQVTMLIISRSDSALTLKRQDDVWRIQPQGLPVDQSAVGRMLDAVADFDLMSLVSESKSYAQYELSDDKRIGLEVFVGDGSALQFDIGKTASTYNHTYVRLENDPGVYQAKGNIRNTFDTDIERLHDKSVLTVALESVMGVSITGGDTSFAVVKSEPPVEISADSLSEGEMEPPVIDPTAAAGPVSSWETDDGAPVDETIFNRLINQLTNLKCDGYIYGKSKEDLGEPRFVIRIGDPEQAELSIFEKREDDKYPAVSSQNDFPFLLSKWKAEQIMKKREDLIKKDEAE